MERNEIRTGDVTGLRCDLHTHSVFSDGTCTPEEIVAEAKKLGLIVALTDHNTVAGLPQFMEAAEKLGVTGVPGVEISTQYEDRELHLLGLFVQPEHYAAIERLVKEQHLLKEISNMELVERLNRAGYSIRYPDVKRRSPTGNANRAHVAAELLEKGYISSIKEAFETILSEAGGYYIPPARLETCEVIRTVRRVGVLPVLAHPLQDMTEQELRKALPILKSAGLAGMETVHSSYTAEMIALAQRIALQFGLLPSGGSDFHGWVKPDIALGTGKGGICIPQQIYLDLLAAWNCCRR